MKFPGSLKVLVISLLLLTACSKSKWSQADQDKWLKSCQESFISNAVKEEDKAQIKDLCKCMLEVTSRDYEVEEASKLSEEQMQKLLQDCNYSY